MNGMIFFYPGGAWFDCRPRHTNCPEIFHDVTQSLEANSGIVSHCTPRLLSSAFCPARPAAIRLCMLQKTDLLNEQEMTQFLLQPSVQHRKLLCVSPTTTVTWYSVYLKSPFLSLSPSPPSFLSLLIVLTCG